jgi:hypothetical protein
MKTVVRTNSNVSLYLLPDEMEVLIDSESMTLGNPPQYLVLDCNISNCLLIENVTNPNGWKGGNYLYVNGEWLPNPEWIEPNQPIT